MNNSGNWPNDVDGDVFRLLEKRNFDFESDHEIDFNIDFSSWPLTKEQEDEILEKLPGAGFVDPDEESLEEGDNFGYVLYTVKGKVTYEFVTQEQKRLTSLFAHFGGVCISWGVFGE